MPEDFDLFSDRKKKWMGLDNLLNTDAYHEKESCRFNLKWINSSKNLKKLQNVGNTRNLLINQYIIQKDKISIKTTA